MNEKVKKLVGNIIIVVLVAILIIVIVIGFSAWTRYISRTNGTATAQLARWNFNLVDTNTQTTDVIELATTRTDTNTTVEQGRIAPGTYGKFEVGIDARGTETTVDYIIEVALYNKPMNLKFYLDEGKTKEMVVDNNILTKTGFMSVEDVKEIRIETIYWEWLFETGSTDKEKQENNEQDTKDANKEVKMKIVVTGIGSEGNSVLN